MHIKTTCPRCHTTFQVEPTLRGKRMRCPRQECRFIFEVREDNGIPAVPAPPGTPAEPTARHASGSVGELIPILQAEALEPPPPEPGSVNPPPPPVRTRGLTPTPAPPPKPPRPARRSAPAEPPPAPAAPAVQAPAEPPPSPPAPPAPEAIDTRGALAAPAEPPPSEQAPDDDFLDALRELGLTDAAVTPDPAPADESSADGPSGYTVADWREGLQLPDEAPPPEPEPEPAPVRKRRRSLLAVVTLLALIGGLVWGGFRLAATRQAGNEADRFERALKQYDERNFAEAAERFRTLAIDFPQSPHEAKYRFLAELSDVLEPLQRSGTDDKLLTQNADRLAQFAAENQDNPLLQDAHRAELHEGFRRLARKFLDLADEQLDRSLLQAHDLLVKEAARYRGKGVAEGKELSAERGRVAQRIADHELLVETVAILEQRRANVSADSVQEARALVAERGLTKNPKVKELLDKLPDAHRAAVTYTAALPPAPGRDRLVEDTPPSLLVTPVLEAHRGKGSPGQRPVLAVARGVLYALEPDSGQVRWAVRVGADTTALPLWLPPSEVAPAQVLVLSSDTPALAALDSATGSTRWCRKLSAPCLGRPVLIAGRAFVPISSGRVEEIELVGGALLGYYELGQPLAGGGAHQTDTHLLYLPADSFCVYVLDVAKRTCAAVLYTGHPGGSLRAPPQVIGQQGAGKATGPQGYLLLAQTEGLGGARLRLFALPVTEADTAPVQEEGPLTGAVWSAAWSDGEKLAVLADSGEFALYALQPRPDRSAPLVPLVEKARREKDRLALSGPGPRHPARSQLVHADGRQFWALAHGGLFRLQYVFRRETGPRLDPPGPELLTPGSPLHAAQVTTDERGETFYLVTQSPDGQTCLATAYDARRGEVRWQRQLGMVPRGQPVVVGDQVLARDVSGRLLLFNSERIRPGPESSWHVGGRVVPGRVGDAGDAFHLLAEPDGSTAHALASVRRQSGPALVVRAFTRGKEPGEPQEFPLPAALAGVPALIGDGVILPLANGVLARQPLAGGGVLTGPYWRAPHADEQAAGYVVPIGADDFLVTDGSRGLARRYLEGKEWMRRAGKELKYRIVSAPAVLPSPDGKGEPQVCVADTADTVTLLNGVTLEEEGRWKLSGRITAGPLVRGGGIVCILEGRRLVWLAPLQDDPPWQPVEFHSDVVGEPQWVDGVLVVAEQRGRFHALDPATGQPAGPGYAVRASAAPAAAPVPFGPDRLFAPLTDGTVLLLSRQCLQHPLRGIPLFR
ncbi:MAG: PQQ-binding-like beta-propeller repeat protein [Gemmataceae bacterium]|nr:PQQ-binding-like beta-propeller repeat protein [Gemmataceae bacterium]